RLHERIPKARELRLRDAVLSSDRRLGRRLAEQGEDRLRHLLWIVRWRSGLCLRRRSDDDGRGPWLLLHGFARRGLVPGDGQPRGRIAEQNVSAQILTEHPEIGFLGSVSGVLGDGLAPERRGLLGAESLGERVGCVREEMDQLAVSEADPVAVYKILE